MGQTGHHKKNLNLYNDLAPTISGMMIRSRGSLMG
jgi:hypothetical protein